MLFYNVVLVYCVLILCAKVVISKEGKQKPLKDSDENLKQTFANLLKTIVTVNEERIQAIKKMTRLQDYILTKNKRKTDDDEFDYMEEEDNRILLAFAGMPQLRRTEDETTAKAMCNILNFELNNVHVWREFLKLACHRHTIVLCERACQKSVSRLCEKFHCNQKTGRDFKTECHENCSNHFEHYHE